jgi:DNA (cytosine-5)-methyltransferase 1
MTAALPLRIDLAPDELVVDGFAGIGGASLGLEEALGRPVDIAINHWEYAISTHRDNHPETEHFCESIFDVDPVVACRGRRVGVAWFSPDCTHHSKARGGKPREKKIRALAWIVTRWAATVAPRIICVENVEEFEDWGPLDDDGRPIKARAGETFTAWVEQLRGLGYAVEWRVLNAADYGAPTARKRLFIVARRDGRAIVWPRPTHGTRKRPFRTAAECIDWSIPALSIFATRAEAKAWAKAHGRGVPRRPLAEATQRRIAEGVRRFVLENPRPFIVTTGHQSSDSGKVRREDQPLSTIVTKAEHLLVSPTLINTRNGEREGQAPRVRDVERPFGTVTAQGSQGAVAMAWLAKHNGSGETWNAAIGSALDEPVHTITGRDTKALAAVHLTKFYGSAEAGVPVDQPMPTITAGGGKGGGHVGAVFAFLTKFYGTGGWQGCTEPLHTIVGHDRFGLVTVEVDGETYVVVDITMRMLEPHELLAAQFGPERAARFQIRGKKKQKVAGIGNSVAPDVALALAAAQLRAPAPRRKPRPVQMPMPMMRGDFDAAAK